MVNQTANITGLNSEQVKIAQTKGKNILSYKKENRLVENILDIAKEPMTILLLVAASIYFISGETGNGIFMAIASLLITSISLYQDKRSKIALEKLKGLTQTKCKVIRNGEVELIPSEELVVGDCLLVEEGTFIAADGIIIHSNDFSVNESILTGESLPVFKDKTKEEKAVYSGTIAVSGLAIAEITAIGNHTKLGNIGTSLANIAEEQTPLEKQIASFVKRMAVLGVLVFLVVWAINYWKVQNILSSLLYSLTLAMSILPEEIPVAFVTFMALGAWRLMKMGILVKQTKTVETLGSATVICTDKTGTLTENKMSLANLYVHSSGQIVSPENISESGALALISSAMLASEPIPFDPMEIAIHQAYGKLETPDERKQYSLVHEYPLSGKPPMMTHVFADTSGKKIIAAKGAPEAIMQVSHLGSAEKQQIADALQQLTQLGYRVLGVGKIDNPVEKYPAQQQDFNFHFMGLLAFYDPPKKNIAEVLTHFYAAGIDVKVITGDNAETTASIAKQIGLNHSEKSISGDELMALPEEELGKKVMETTLFTRMFPEAKLRIINALKSKQQIVAMTGDGVNDGPALKAAHIGIAMGKAGSEIAKQAASLVLLEDDLSKMVDAIAMGRKIYTNLKKAIQYIISIHIPIILTVFIPLALGWIYPNIFSPIHIIFLELIMGPTCSIIYENEPMEPNTMTQKPKALTNTFFNWKELSVSVVQGIVITLGVLLSYQYAVVNNYSETLTRTMVFTTLIHANIMLTLVNRSFFYSIISTLKYKNNLVWSIISLTIALLILVIYVPSFSLFFGFSSLNLIQLSVSIALGFGSAIWYEAVKIIKRKNQKATK